MLHEDFSVEMFYGVILIHVKIMTDFKVLSNKKSNLPSILYFAGVYLLQRKTFVYLEIFGVPQIIKLTADVS